MTNLEPTDARMEALEGSLHAGPTDEDSYRAAPIDFQAVASNEGKSERQRSPGTVRIRRGEFGRDQASSLASSIAILLVLVVGGFVVVRSLNGIGSGEPSPPLASPAVSASPIPVPSLTETFVSLRNGFSVKYPAAWSTKAATSSWRPGTYVPIGNPALDVLQQEGTARLVVASQQLADGQTEASFVAAFVQPFDLGFCTLDRASWPRVTVDGQLGYLDVEACPAAVASAFSSPDLRFDVLVFSGGRVYEIALDGVVDRAYFEAIVATIRLAPSSAIDPPAAS